MDRTYDVIVCGLGVMGSAACWQLARRGLTVLGLERFDIPHTLGSSHGRSRVIRKAYFEDPRYVPLLHRAYELWHELEAAAEQELFVRTGCLNLGPADHPCVRGILESVRQHRLPYEVMSADEVRRRFPAIRPAEHDIAVYEADAGFLRAEGCVRALADQARAAGAELRTNERVAGWNADDRRVAVRTDGGEHTARSLVLTAGPWLPVLAADLRLSLRVERQVPIWFRPLAPERFSVGRLPVFIHFLDDRAYYGIPDDGRSGVKIARHHGGATVDPETVDRTCTADDEADVRGYIRRHLPEADGPLLDATVCLYTNTPDRHFLIDRHPQQSNVLIAGGFSGHGFKFAPVVGSVLADLATAGRTDLPIDPFRIERLRIEAQVMS